LAETEIVLGSVPLLGDKLSQPDGVEDALAVKEIETPGDEDRETDEDPDVPPAVQLSEILLGFAWMTGEFTVIETETVTVLVAWGEVMETTQLKLPTGRLLIA
jgi:hypothetical protein